MRAYGGAAAEALRRAGRVEILPRVAAAIEVPFEHIGALYRLLDTFNGDDRTEAYTDLGLRIAVRLLASDFERFAGMLRDATRGQCSVTRL
jgi:putative IMPACT (imprinted ancient) family translation regulator